MKIDSEKPCCHNFSEEIKPKMTREDENSKADNKFSLDENATEKKNICRDGIYDEKTITEIKIPDKVVNSENIIKDVCVDEGIKMDFKITKEKEITEETKDASKYMHDLKPTVDEKEILVEEMSDEKISLKELFYSEDRKLVELDSCKKAETTSDNKQTVTQNTTEDFFETSTNGSENHKPDIRGSLNNVSADNIILEEVIHQELPSSIVIPSSSAPSRNEIKDPELVEESPTSDTALTFVQLDDNGIVNAHRGQESFDDGPKITAHKSLSQSYGEMNIPRSVVTSEPKGNSAHLAYSGSISMRSDSSTTSARSFAFPILRSEWNSSPVKMAKADRRRFRRHGRWRSSIGCCGFQN